MRATASSAEAATPPERGTACRTIPSLPTAPAASAGGLVGGARVDAHIAAAGRGVHGHLHLAIEPSAHSRLRVRDRLSRDDRPRRRCLRRTGGNAACGAGADPARGRDADRAQGRLLLLADAADGWTTDALLDAAIDEHVVFVPVASFRVPGEGARELRLAFSFESPEPLAEGARRLGRVFERVAATAAAEGAPPSRPLGARGRRPNASRSAPCRHRCRGQHEKTAQW